MKSSTLTCLKYWYQLICKHSWLGALCRECLLPSQKLEQRHECLQINPSGDSEMLRLVVAVLDKDVAIAFAPRLEAKHLRTADAKTLGWSMYYYTFVDQEDIDEIIEEHLVKGNKVERLLIDSDEDKWKRKTAHHEELINQSI